MIEFFLLMVACYGVVPNPVCVSELTKEGESIANILSPTPYTNMLLSSGITPNDLGDYESCNDISIARYAVLKTPLHIVLTACVPKECSKEDLAYLLNSSLKPFLNQTLEVTPSMIEFPKDFYEDNCKTLGAGQIMMILVITMLACAVIFGTLLDFYIKYLPNGSPLSQQLYVKIGLCFSFLYNFNKLSDSRTGQTAGERDTMDVLNGIRVMSIGWVLLGHVTQALLTESVLVNYEEITSILVEPKKMIIVSGVFAVDTFFWLSGLLMSYLLLKELNSSRGMNAYKWVMLYVHRYLRLTPLLLFCMLFWWSMNGYLGNGPIWYRSSLLVTDCPDYWWTVPLYLNNFVPDYKGNSCFGHTWYLANDMQFFIISPLILFAYHKKRVVGWVLICLLIGESLLSSGIIAYHFDLNPTLLGPGSSAFFPYYYVKPYVRIGPYILGLALGMILYSYRLYKTSGQVYDLFCVKFTECFSNPVFRYLMFFIGNFLVAFFTFILYDDTKNTNQTDYDHWNSTENILFYTFNRVGFILGLTLLILPSLLGYLPYLTLFLGHSLWTPFARMSYAIYLMHLYFIYTVYMSQQTALYFDDYNLTRDVVYFWLFSIFMAFVVVMLVEYPFMNLERLLLKKRTPEPKSDSKTTPLN